MKPAMWSRAAVLVLPWCALAAQGQIYESKEKGGVPVFSDQPTTGASPVTLPPPNVSDAPMPAAGPQPVVAAPYSQLSIVSPAAAGTVHTNTGAFDVSVSLYPALDSRGGDRFMVKLDGAALPGRYASATIGISSQDFEAAAGSGEPHQLEVAVVDSAGKVLITAAPVKFYVRRATVRERRR